MILRPKTRYRRKLRIKRCVKCNGIVRKASRCKRCHLVQV